MTKKLDTYSEEWRHQCEVRYVARMTPNDRGNYFSDVRKHRKDAAVDKLMNDVQAIINLK
jgi:hypothetical protein